MPYPRCSCPSPGDMRHTWTQESPGKCLHRGSSELFFRTHGQHDSSQAAQTDSTAAKCHSRGTMLAMCQVCQDPPCLLCHRSHRASFLRGCRQRLKLPGALLRVPRMENSGRKPPQTQPRDWHRMGRGILGAISHEEETAFIESRKTVKHNAQHRSH